MDSTEEDILRRAQVKASLGMVLDKVRLDAVLEQVRAQFEDDLRALTDAEQDSKELKSARSGICSSTGSRRRSTCRSRWGPRPWTEKAPAVRTVRRS